MTVNLKLKKGLVFHFYLWGRYANRQDGTFARMEKIQLLEKEKAQPQSSVYDQPLSSEEEIILQTKPDKSDAVLSGS